jgi:two-component system, chemotaxis family, chemotaxis protein CheY
MKILIADDDFYCRQLMRAYLSPLGECNAATNGAEAVAAFVEGHNEGKPYDLICLDIMMPEVDGMEALKRIRDIEEREMLISRQNRCAIAMVTALEDMKTIMASFHSLCDAYVMKPIEQQQLLEQIRLLGFKA